ncbi:MAG TPA: sodium:proton antiporter [Planctomycetaceae bacterium]|nr:sodium:proton antiporter [Planctomycetaceae bacterium]
MSEKNTNDHHDLHAHVEEPVKEPSYGLTLVAIILILCMFGWLLHKGLPQEWTRIAHGGGHATHTEHGVESGREHGGAVPTETGAGHDVAPADTPTGTPAKEGHDEVAGKPCPPYLMIAPFALLLLAIALFPLIPATEHWWESNLHRFYVAGGLGVVTLLYYGFACHFPVELHWPGHGVTTPEMGPVAMMWTVFKNAIIGEFIPFITLLFALYAIAGGIRIQGDLKASPFVNTVIIAIGTLLASFVGTTGAAMLMIRLLLETNKERRYKVHTVVFFIFCVCNCGGCLLPIGDPPLFLGYLRGVDFLWTFSLWKEWLFVNAILIALYFLIDTCWFYRRESKEDKVRDTSETVSLRIRGAGLNVVLLLGVVLAVMYLAPEKNFFDNIGVKQLCAALGHENRTWHPPFFLREAVQLTLVLLSLGLGSRAVRRANNFNFGAIIEVAALFFGIFLCMQAPLQILNAKGKELPLQTPIHYYWATGTLSSVLDNAPTYVVFFEAAKAQENARRAEAEAAGGESLEKYLEHEKEARNVPVSGGKIPWDLLVAVSLGSVFMGAMTYIGNGPNFMVKAIAEQSGVKMPSFFGYMVYSCLILLPIFLLMNYVFLRLH